MHRVVLNEQVVVGAAGCAGGEGNAGETWGGAGLAEARLMVTIVHIVALCDALAGALEHEVAGEARSAEGCVEIAGVAWLLTGLAGWEDLRVLASKFAVAQVV